MQSVNKKIGRRKYEKGMRRCSSDDFENMGKLFKTS
jgi:hypothetical protein